MGILENFENAWDLHNEVDKPEPTPRINTESAWDKEFSFESKPMIETNNLGEPVTHDNHPRC
jgi:hypothetical protein